MEEREDRSAGNLFISIVKSQIMMPERSKNMVEVDLSSITDDFLTGVELFPHFSIFFSCRLFQAGQPGFS